MLVIFNIIFIAFIGAIIVFIRQYRIKKKAHDNELALVDALHKEELLKTQMEIQKETMKQIGSEIHDNVGQKLTLSSLYLQQIPLEEQSPDIVSSIKNINNLINESLDDLRHLSRSLTDDAIESSSISDLINNECDRVNTFNKIEVIFKDSLKQEVIPYQVKSVLLRITQEFIQNSIKHANCMRIFVELTGNIDTLKLRLTDDGKGFDIKKVGYKGIGLNNMKRRVKIINGVFALKSDFNAGTELSIEIPKK